MEVFQYFSPNSKGFEPKSNIMNFQWKKNKLNVQIVIRLMDVFLLEFFIELRFSTGIENRSLGLLYYDIMLNLLI